MLPTFVASWNGGPATARAFELVQGGTPLLEALVAGVQIVEDDPKEMSVGFGGLPNEEGEVELDAAVMDGPTHKAGAVAGLRGVRHAAAVALEVLRRTDHALLVGEGARRFARQCGFRDEDLLTPEAREAWLLWKASLSTRDAWLGPEETGGRAGSDFGAARWAGHHTNPNPGGPPRIVSQPKTDMQGQVPKPGESGGRPEVPFTFGTIHVSGIDANANLASVTTTSGLSYKIPGRAGDTPIVGAGLYTDNDTGSAGCTGRGEATMHNCTAYAVVQAMRAGMPPQEACLLGLRELVRTTREPRLLRADGRPHFNCTVYALRKDGELGAASIHPGYMFIAQRGATTELASAAALFAG